MNMIGVRAGTIWGGMTNVDTSNKSLNGIYRSLLGERISQITAGVVNVVLAFDDLR